MGVVFMASADMGDPNMWSTVYTVDCSATQFRTGSQSFRFSGSGSYLRKSGLAARADYYVRAALYLTSGATSPELRFYEGGTTTQHVTIIFDTVACTIQTRRGTSSGTVLNTTYVPIIQNRWHVLEVYVKVADSNGQVTIKLDGVQVVNLTGAGVDTRNSGASGVIDCFTIYNSPSTLYVDDVVIRDDAWPGAGGLFVQVPTGPGVNAGFTASAGNPYECVDEVPIAASDYIAKDVSVLNIIHDFAHAGLPAGTYVTVPAYGVVSKGKLSGSGSGNIRNKALSSGSVANGASSPLSTSEAWTTALYGTTNPNGGGALSKAVIDAMTFGVETI